MFWQAGFAHGVSTVLAHFERAFKWLATEAAIATREQMVATLSSRFNTYDLGLITCPLIAARTAEILRVLKSLSVRKLLARGCRLFRSKLCYSSLVAVEKWPREGGCGSFGSCFVLEA